MLISARRKLTAPSSRSSAISCAVPKPGPDFGDELCLLLRIAVQSLDQGPLFLRPGSKIGNLPRHKPELSRETEVFGLLLLQPVQPFPDLRIGTGSLLNTVILGLLVCKEGKRSFEVLCLCGICVPFTFKGLLLLEKTGIRGLLLGEQFQVGVEFCRGGLG